MLRWSMAEFWSASPRLLDGCLERMVQERKEALRIAKGGKPRVRVKTVRYYDEIPQGDW